MYDQQHSRNSSATHTPYPSHSTEGMSRGQSHSSNTLYPNQTPIPNQFWTNSSWPDQDVKPSISGDLRGVPSAPGYTSENMSYFPQGQPGSVGHPVQGAWPDPMNQQMSRGGYENYPGLLQNPARMNVPNTGQSFGNGPDRYMSYGAANGMNARYVGFFMCHVDVAHSPFFLRYYHCPVCQRNPCACGNR
jgi:hypothetical protein